MTAVAPSLLPVIDPTDHFRRTVFPLEHEELDECPIDIRNIGWTLGNDCPFRCSHCYSMSARKKGADMSVETIDRIVSELVRNGVETVNLGGNEPLYTNGTDARKSLLPYIIEQLVGHGILVGITTAGPSLVYLDRHHPEIFRLLNDADISFDSPIEAEHNGNRGAKLYSMAVQCLKLCQLYDIPHSIIMCGMNWNFTEDHLLALVGLAKRYEAHVRINPLKPVEPGHMASALTSDQYYAGFSLLMQHCDPVDLGEPPIGTVTNFAGAGGCPCGRTSFRIHSVTPDGKIPVSPCVYLHDYKVGNLVTDDLYDIVRSPQFRSFRRRNAHPEAIPGCKGCSLIAKCRGGCAARSYLHHAHSTGQRSLFVQDPYCPREVQPDYPFPQEPVVPTDHRMVHMDYLCTWIGKPR